MNTSNNKISNDLHNLNINRVHNLKSHKVHNFDSNKIDAAEITISTFELLKSSAEKTTTNKNYSENKKNNYTEKDIKNFTDEVLIEQLKELILREKKEGSKKLRLKVGNRTRSSRKDASRFIC